MSQQQILALLQQLTTNKTATPEPQLKTVDSVLKSESVEPEEAVKTLVVTSLEVLQECLSGSGVVVNSDAALQVFKVAGGGTIKIWAKQDGRYRIWCYPVSFSVQVVRKILVDAVNNRSTQIISELNIAGSRNTTVTVTLQQFIDLGEDGG